METERTENEKRVELSCERIDEIMEIVSGLTEEERLELLWFINSHFCYAKES